MINPTKPLSSIALPSIDTMPGKLGTANRNNSSTVKNTGKDTRINNREILIIKMQPEK